MKTQTRQMNSGEKDWNKMEEYLHSVMPNIEGDLTKEFTFLETVEPFVELEKYPPRISVCFLPKGKRRGEGYALFRLLPQYEEELKGYQERISLIISTIASRNGLEAIKGIIHTYYDEQTNRRGYTRELGEYTLRPFYNKFVVKD